MTRPPAGVDPKATEFRWQAEKPQNLFAASRKSHRKVSQNTAEFLLLVG